ncbi:MAG: calcineurin-like phosphoesterase C-terminal domain-containing protein [Gemmatimonadota bacterium]
MTPHLPSPFLAERVRSVVGLALLLWVWLPAASLEAQTTSASATVSGVVFEDTNGNRLRDPGEAGIPGVLVSNQRQVTRSGSDGGYELPVEAGMAIYVQQPPTHRVPVNHLNLPQFSYVYEPEGSPPLRYGGMPATGPLPAQLDFPLLPGAPAMASQPFQVVAFGDPQPRDDREVDFIRDDAVAEIRSAGADFAIILGDVMYDDLSLYGRYNQIMARAGLPLWNVVGNHDIDFDAGGNRHGRDTFRRHFGANYYSFQYGDVLFVMLDNVDYMGRDGEGRTQYRGMVGSQQMEWLENLMAETPDDLLVVLGMHIPLFAWDGEMAVTNTADRGDLFRVLQGRRVLALTGHIHMIYHHLLGDEVGWEGPEPLHQLTTATASGTWWGGPEDKRGVPVATARDGTPNGFHVLTFLGANYAERFKGFGFDPEFQIRVTEPLVLGEPMPGPWGVGPDPAGEIRGQGEWIVANFFSGSADSRLWMSVNGGHEVEMERFSGSSPFFRQLLDGFPGSFGQNQAIPTNHLWRAPVPQELHSPGTHVIEIRALDRYGQSHRGSRVVEVATAR